MSQRDCIVIDIREVLPRNFSFSSVTALATTVRWQTSCDSKKKNIIHNFRLAAINEDAHVSSMSISAYHNMHLQPLWLGRLPFLGFLSGEKPT